jgi:fatty-acyl-CoA synthase
VETAGPSSITSRVTPQALTDHHGHKGATHMTAMTLSEHIEKLEHCHRQNILGGGSSPRRFTWSELHGDVRRTAGALSRQGVQSGDPVLMDLHTEYGTVVDFLALAYLGAVPVSVKPMPPGPARDRYLETVCRQIGARAAHASLGEVAGGLRALDNDRDAGAPAAVPRAAACGAEETAFIQYTSGSTSAPKPVRVTHGSLAANIAGITAFEGRDEHGVVLNAMPLNHDMGLVGGLLRALYGGNRIVLVATKTFLRDAVNWLLAAHEAGATTFAMPNFLVRYITYRVARERPQDPLFSAFRAIFLGAEPIGLQTTTSLLAVGQPLGLDPSALIFAYGMAEATLMVSGHRFVDAATSFDTSSGSPVACCGRAIDGIEWTIGPSEDDTGPVLLRGESMCLGPNGEDYRQAWFDTGDVGYTRDGNLYLCGRSGDMVPLHGRNLFAADVEEYIRSSWPVDDVVMVPDRDRYSVFVAPRGTAAVDVEELTNSLAGAFGVPPRAVTLGHRRDIPRTTSGKPRRHAMRQHFATAHAEA